MLRCQLCTVDRTGHVLDVCALLHCVSLSVVGECIEGGWRAAGERDGEPAPRRCLCGLENDAARSFEVVTPPPLMTKLFGRGQG